MALQHNMRKIPGSGWTLHIQEVCLEVLGPTAMPRTVAGSNSSLFYVKTPEGTRLRSPSEGYGWSRDNRTGSCDNSQCQSIRGLRRVRENVVQNIAASLEVTESKGKVKGKGKFQRRTGHEGVEV